MTDVVAAIIMREGKYLIARRPAHKARGLLWEFVGGKTEAGETREQALMRECREELGIGVRIRDLFAQVTHRYPDLTVRLTLFTAEIEEGEPQPLEHAEIRWVAAEQLPEYDFCPADEEIIRKLAGAKP